MIARVAVTIEDEGAVVASAASGEVTLQLRNGSILAHERDHALVQALRAAVYDVNDQILTREHEERKSEPPQSETKSKPRKRRVKGQL